MTDTSDAPVPTDPTDPELAADVDCADGDVEQHIGDPVADGDDVVEVAIDAMAAEDEDDLDGDGQPDPPDEHEEG